jgi:hypothetical protein
MSLPIPPELIYDNKVQTLPPEVRFTHEILTPSNTSSLKAGGFAEWNLPTTQFLNQKSLYLKFNYLMAGLIDMAIPGTPAYTFIYRIQITCGGFSESISGYNIIQNLRINTTHDPAQKYGMQPMYGYNDSTTVPTLEKLDGRKCVANEAGDMCVPLDCAFFNCLNMIPLFGMPQINIKVFFESATNIVVSGTGTVACTDYTLSDVYLCFEQIDMGRDYEQQLINECRQNGPFELKSTMWDYTSQTQASWTGSTDLNFPLTKKWLKSAFVLFGGTTVESHNKAYDAYDFSTNAGEISISVGGQSYPNSRPLQIRNKGAVLMSLKQAVGNYTDKNNNMSINDLEVNKAPNGATTYDVPAKCYFGFNLNRYQRTENTEYKKNICSGVSTDGKSVIVRATTITAPAVSYNVQLITLSDVIIKIDVATKNVSLEV